MRDPLSFGPASGVTLSISFTPSRSGQVDLTVIARDASRKCLGTGTKLGAMIKKGDVAAVSVQLRHDCPDADGGQPPDAAVPDGAVTFQGCDPAMPATSCENGQTCFVNCVSQKGMCVAGGTKGPGETCVSNTDCMPGTQCFDYSNVTGCAQGTRICLKFCANDAHVHPGQVPGRRRWRFRGRRCQSRHRFRRRHGSPGAGRSVVPAARAGTLAAREEPSPAAPARMRARRCPWRRRRWPPPRRPDPVRLPQSGGVQQHPGHQLPHLQLQL